MAENANEVLVLTTKSQSNFSLITICIIVKNKKKIRNRIQNNRLFVIFGASDSIKACSVNLQVFIKAFSVYIFRLNTEHLKLPMTLDVSLKLMNYKGTLSNKMFSKEAEKKELLELEFVLGSLCRKTSLTSPLMNLF